ncbi:hypothetical protein CspeluHIS016_0105190 [Cutaneotrichosporon spelunceum]|uniref:Cora-domain-containing protein n=1 Tax=Cutaneotrichosporon spelunceum TaxID=1672016 RepID=A0AAD3Y9F9_9TREE|nr:hypothetical protein CspeluHIS016_0105190 [Cutaneotrichosporon spelunceum]
MAPPSPAGAHRGFSPNLASSPQIQSGEDIELPELNITENERTGVQTARSPRFAPLPGGTRVAPSTPANPPAVQPAAGRATSAHAHGSSLTTNPTLTSAAPSTPATGAPPTPILTQTPAPNPDSDRPEFAELLTPAQLRKRRRPHATLALDTPEGLDPSPAADPAQTVPNDDAVTVSSGSSSSSSWSWGSGGVAGATRAVVQRIGGAIGVRRGSMSTVDTGYASSATSSSSSSEGAATRVIGRLGRALTRTVSRGTIDSTEERPRRVYVPRRREFTLLLPDDNWTPGDATPLSTPPLEMTSPAPTPTARVITTPVLQPILEAVKKARAAAGITPDLAIRQRQHRRKEVAMRRGGSAPGRSRQPRTFTAPLPRRPAVPRTLSRLEELRATSGVPLPVRPKSASDLLGMVGARSDSVTSLGGLVGELETKTSSPQKSVDEHARPRGAWWLDVSCPTWKDLRDIGELLSIHPLTLEDVLHQDPREKLDTFDALGYYFIAVRALDEQYFKYTPGSVVAPPGAELTASGVYPTEEPAQKKKERQRRGWGFGRATGRAASKSGEKVEIVEDNPGKEGLEGIAVGGINLYLAVFADGIVTFHYGDVSKHTSRVRDRALSVRTYEPTSDWIAHGLLDSIVDAFFPLTGYVDGAVDDMDALTTDPTRDPRDQHRGSHIDGESPADAPYTSSVEDFADGHDDTEWIAMDEKLVMEQRKSKRERVARQLDRVQLRAQKSNLKQLAKKAAELAFSRSNVDGRSATSRLGKAILYAKLFFLPITDALPSQRNTAPEVFDRTTVLNSMTNLRRLVTGLSRLLDGKHIVVASLLKRVRTHSGGASGVEAYLSDVHDHILLLQTSLYHYEYILANCQPTYISHLMVSGSTSRGNISTLVLTLSIVSIGILPMQFVTGIFSMNVYVPHNLHPDVKKELNLPGPTKLNLFGIVVAIVFLVACGLVFIIRWWRWTARKKWNRLRGAEVPDAWDGFWGWA